MNEWTQDGSDFTWGERRPATLFCLVERDARSASWRAGVRAWCGNGVAAREGFATSAEARAWCDGVVVGLGIVWP